jgi:hypothetical protein
VGGLGWAKRVVRVGEKRNACRVLVGKSGWMRLIRRCNRRRNIDVCRTVLTQRSDMSPGRSSHSALTCLQDGAHTALWHVSRTELTQRSDMSIPGLRELVHVHLIHAYGHAVGTVLSGLFSFLVFSLLVTVKNYTFPIEQQLSSALLEQQSFLFLSKNFKIKGCFLSRTRK